ncbi:MAG: TIGR03435 family protein [Bryobacterales bacterium]|nr:TIGR03435 family protein [Bryobacterales bacterium]MBV9397759.1 TIGR03435 family protein [Bryobacterales bacterium]
MASVKRGARPVVGTGVRDGARGGPGTADPTLVVYTNLRLKDLLLTAYGLKDYQVAGPDWLDTERYDIVAKVPPNASKDQFALMLQSLLVERFKLITHHESKELPLYNLVVAKNGPRMKAWADHPSTLQPTAPAGPPTLGTDGFPQVLPGHFAILVVNGHNRLTASKLSVGKLADMLASQLGRPVLDKTGLTGEYDYRLEFSPEGLGRGVPAAATPDDQDVVSLFGAVQEQLGLKLTKGQGTIDVMVIDHAQKVPIEN